MKVLLQNLERVLTAAGRRIVFGISLFTTSAAGHIGAAVQEIFAAHKDLAEELLRRWQPAHPQEAGRR